jgi:hypothetical protein
MLLVRKRRNKTCPKNRTTNNVFQKLRRNESSTTGVQYFEENFKTREKINQNQCQCQFCNLECSNQKKLFYLA